MRLYNVIDVETTDLTDAAELLEIASCILTLDMERRTVVGQPMTQLFRPHERPISPDARAVHHISPAMVRDCFPVTAEDRSRFLWRPDVDGTVLVVVAHNIEYEAKFFPEFASIAKICTMKCALRVWPEAPSHKNGALYYWLMERDLIPDLGDAAQPMHRAGPDTLITAFLLAALLQNATTNQMLQWTQEPRLLPNCPIGEWKDKPWHEVDHGFLTWMTNKAGMEEDFKWNARREINRRAQRPAS